jgi:hypothetical protein
MRPKLLAIAHLLAALTFLSGCPIEGEAGFKSTDQEFMRELRIALTEANILFREDEAGFLKYRPEDAATASKIRENLEKELHSGLTVKYEDAEATQYLRGMLASMGMKYRVEQRTDGEWTRWYPQNETQGKEIPMKVVEHMFELKKKQLSTKCKQDTSPASTPLHNEKLRKTSSPC